MENVVGIILIAALALFTVALLWRIVANKPWPFLPDIGICLILVGAAAFLMFFCGEACWGMFEHELFVETILIPVYILLLFIGMSLLMPVDRTSSRSPDDTNEPEHEE